MVYKRIGPSCNFVAGKTLELLDWQKGFLSQSLEPLEPVFSSSDPQQDFQLAFCWPQVWGHLLFFPKTRSYFFKESMPHLKTVVGEDDGPLDQGPGEMCWAKKDERKIPSQNASAFFAPSSLLPRTWHFQWRGPQTCQGSFS